MKKEERLKIEEWFKERYKKELIEMLEKQRINKFRWEKCREGELSTISEMTDIDKGKNEFLNQIIDFIKKS